MDTTELLLQYDPKEAIVMMLNLENGSNFRPEDIEVGPPTAGTTRNTRVVLTVKKPAGRNHEIPYHGQLTFEYNRLHVPHHFDGVLGGLDVQLPTSSQVLLNHITERVGQRFVLDDFVLEDIGAHNAYSFLLTAKAESHRWYGAMVVRLGDVASLEDAIGALMPDTLGPLAGPNPFNVLNLGFPYINGTPYQDEIAALTLNQPAQFDPAVKELIDILAPMMETPQYRPPLHTNSHFESGALGWSMLHAHPNPPTPVEGSYSFGTNRCDMTFVKDIFTVSRALTMSENTLVEVTFRVEQFEGSGTFPIPVTLQIVNGTTVEVSATVQVKGVGVYQAYMRAPTSGSRLVQWKATAIDRLMTLSSLSWRSLPKQWMVPEPLALPEVAKVQSAPTILSYVDGELRYGQYGTGTILFEAKLLRGRYYTCEFDVVEIGDGLLDFQAVEDVSGAVVKLGSYQASTAAHAIGQRAQIVLYVPESLAEAWKLRLSASNPGLSTTRLERLKLYVLPMPHGVDVIPNYDVYGRAVSIDSVGNFGASSPVPGSGSWSIVNGFLTMSVNTSDGYGIRFKTPPFHSRERYSIIVDNVASHEIDQSAYEYYTGVRISQTAGDIQAKISGIWMPWNQGDVVRYLSPTVQYYRGAVSPGASGAPVTIDLYGYTYATGIAVPNAFMVGYRRISVEVSYPAWSDSVAASRRTLYGACLTSRASALLDPLNSLHPLLLTADRFDLDLTYCREFTSSKVVLPYMPHAQILGRFLPISQFGRYGTVTAEDVTPYRDQLRLLEVDDVIDGSNAPSVMLYDPTQAFPWVVSPVAALKNLQGATVLYNGAIRETDPLPANPGLDQILVVLLDSTLCTGYKGVMRFYYNGRYPT